jgi:hypothetical protein
MITTGQRSRWTLPSTSPVRVVVLDRVECRPDDLDDAPSRGLSVARQSLLAALVAAGPSGVPAVDLTSAEAPESATAQSALRMAITRLRPHLPPGAIPDAAHGRYRLALPTEAVDAWLLLDLAGGADLTEVDVATLRHLVRATEPYAGVPSGEALDDSTYVIDAARRRLTMRLSHERPEVLDGSMRADVLAHLDAEPHNDDLVRVAVRCLLDTGDRRTALTVLSRAAHGLADAGLTLPTDLLAVERDLLAGVTPTALVTQPGRDDAGAGGRSRHPTDRTSDRAHDAPRRRDLPVRLRDDLLTSFIGDRSHIDTVIDRLESARNGVTTVVVRGLAGAGKSRLLAEVARAMFERDWAVVDAVASPPPATSALGPIVAALPSLHETVRVIRTMALDLESRRASMWDAVRTALSEHADGRPLLLLIDDAQWLDSQTTEFVLQLITSSADAPEIAVVLAGRSDPAAAQGWDTLAAAATREGALDLTPAELDEGSMAAFIEERRPSLTLRERNDIVGELTRRSGGLPGVAAVLLAGYDPAHRRLPTAQQLSRDSAAAFLSEGDLDTAARTVGAVAAVIGGDVGLDEIMAIAGLSADDALEGVDQLVRRDLMVERSPVRFATTHALADAALLAGVSRQQIARWHAAAARVRSADVHRAAQHLAGAVPLVPIRQAVDAQLQSADALLDTGLAREAADAYNSAELLAGSPLQPSAAVGQSRALDLAGAHGVAEDVRARAIADALAEADHTTALRLATSGLPEAEAVEGSPVTVTNLESVDPTALSRHDRWVHAMSLARQASLVGRLDQAVESARAAQTLAFSHDEKVSSAVAMRSVRSAITEPAVRLAVLDEVADDVAGAAPDRRAEYLLLRAIDLFELGDTDAAVACHAELMAVDPLPALRRWHGELFAAMAAADRGDASTASRLRSAAAQFAMSAGFREGESAYLIAEFVDLWLAGATGLLLPAVESGAIDPERAPATRAAVAIVLDAAGRHDDALVQAESATQAVVESPSYQGIPALALAAGIVARSDRRDLVDRAAALLATRGPSMLVLGAGAASLGPVDRYLAHLATDDTTRTHHLTRALQTATRAASPRWTDVLRSETPPPV